MAKKKIDRILILGDKHLPFCDWEALEQARVFAKENKVQKVMSAGDLTEQKFWNRFIKDPHDDGGGAEWDKTLVAAEELNKMFPELDILDSNHDRRYIKKAKEAGLVDGMIKGLHEIFPYKGWNWRLQANPVVINNVAYMHGDELNGSVKVKAQILGMSVVQGHSHKAELVYLNTFKKHNFAMDVGCMVDAKSAAFDYAAKYLNKIWVGFGYIEDGIPYLIPKK